MHKTFQLYKEDEVKSKVLLIKKPPILERTKEKKSSDEYGYLIDCYW